MDEVLKLGLDQQWSIMTIEQRRRTLKKPEYLLAKLLWLGRCSHSGAPGQVLKDSRAGAARRVKLLLSRTPLPSKFWSDTMRPKRVPGQDPSTLARTSAKAVRCKTVLELKGSWKRLLWRCA